MSSELREENKFILSLSRCFLIDFVDVAKLKIARLRKISLVNTGSCEFSFVKAMEGSS